MQKIKTGLYFISCQSFRSLSFALFFFSFSSVAHAEVIAVSDSDILLIQGDAAKIVLREGGASVSPQLDVRGSGFSVDRKDRLILIQQKRAQANLEIVGMSLPGEIHLKNGRIEISGWSRDLKITQQEGAFVSDRMAGALELDLTKGDVAISQMTGRLAARGYQGSWKISQASGGGELDLFSGALKLTGVSGTWKMATNNVQTHIADSSGEFQGSLQQGLLSFQKVSGRVQFENKDGTVSVVPGTDLDANIVSSKGKVTVQIPRVALAFLDVTNADGELTVPGNVRVTRKGRQKHAQTERSAGQKFKVQLRSQEGSLTIKEGK